MDFYRLTFLRHGESVGNANGRIQGCAKLGDFPLTDNGMEQARRLLARWKREGRLFDRVIASPLLRASQTADIIAGGLNLPLELDPTWMERDVGLISGLSREEAEERSPRPEFFTPYSTFASTGESDWQLYLRAGKGLQSLFSRPPGSYLVVSHGGILNQLCYAIFGIGHQANGQGLSFGLGNTGFMVFLYKPDNFEWDLLTFNDQGHLESTQ